MQKVGDLEKINLTEVVLRKMFGQLDRRLLTALVFKNDGQLFLKTTLNELRFFNNPKSCRQIIGKYFGSAWLQSQTSHWQRQCFLFGASYCRDVYNREVVSVSIKYP